MPLKKVERRRRRTANSFLRISAILLSRKKQFVSTKKGFCYICHSCSKLKSIMSSLLLLLHLLIWLLHLSRLSSCHPRGSSWANWLFISELTLYTSAKPFAAQESPRDHTPKSAKALPRVPAGSIGTSSRGWSRSGSYLRSLTIVTGPYCFNSLWRSAPATSFIALLHLSHLRLMSVASLRICMPHLSSLLLFTNSVLKWIFLSDSDSLILFAYVASPTNAVHAEREYAGLLRRQRRIISWAGFYYLGFAIVSTHEKSRLRF